tara:strand:- start:28 stop:534 length:507 start_codon:yes stop_codon:yes gene_type:complete
MENFQTKIRELIYEECFIIYKKCLKLTLKTNNILEIKFNNKLAKELLNIKFIDNLSNNICVILNRKNNLNINKIINYHFKNIKIKNIEGSYKIESDKKKQFNELVNPIKWDVLNKFYGYIELGKLENNIFNILNFNEFIYYHIKYKNIFLQPLGYLILVIFIFYLVDN